MDIYIRSLRTQFGRASFRNPLALVASESEFDHALNPVAVDPMKVFRGEGSGVVVCLTGGLVFFRCTELGA